MFDWFGQRLFRYVHSNHLVYASCWEDPEADLLGLELTPEDRLLMITSAGCNALDYLLEGPSEIDAVDVNFRQNALLELKRAAIRVLEWKDLFQIFGHGHHPHMRELYGDLLRATFDERYHPFWDREIRLFAGKLPFYFRTTSGYLARWFAFYIDRVIKVRPAIDALLNAPSVAEQIAVYERSLKDRIWGPWLGWALGKDSFLSLTGIPPQQRQQLLRFEPNVQNYLQRQAERIIYRLPIRENYFWRVYLTGRYTVDCCPRYLKESSLPLLRSRLDRLTCHTASVTEFLQSSEHNYSRFVLLDHMDWLTGKQLPLLRDEWQAIVDRAAPAARVLWRSLGVQTEFIDELVVQRHGAHSLGKLLTYDHNSVAKIRNCERVTAYGFIGLAVLP